MVLLAGSATMDAIKRALRKLFGRKDKQQPEKSTAASSATTSKTTSQQTGTPNHVPPTHPLSTGQHSKPQNAVPVNTAAHSSAASDARAPGGARGLQKTREQERDTHNVSPVAPTADGARSEPVSVVDREQAPAPPPKTDGAADAINAAVPEAAVAAPAGMMRLRHVSPP